MQTTLLMSQQPQQMLHQLLATIILTCQTYHYHSQQMSMYLGQVLLKIMAGQSQVIWQVQTLKVCKRAMSNACTLSCAH